MKLSFICLDIMPSMKKRNVLISALVFLVLLAVAAFLIFQQPALEPQEEEQATQELQNPIEDEIPDVNPTANTNPFGDTYKNPFE